MTAWDAQVEVRRSLFGRHHGFGHVVVVDLAGNWPVWERLCGPRMRYVGYTGDDPSGAAGAILAAERDVDVVDVGGRDPWGLYADVLSGFRGRAVTVFMSVPSSALRLDGGMPRYVWERAGVPFDWGRWNGPAFDALVLRAGLSYAWDRGFSVEEAVAVRFLGKPFPWRYNHVGLRLRSEWGENDGQGDGGPGVQGQGADAGGEPPPARP